MSLGNMLIVGFLRKFLLSLWMDYKEVWEPNYLCVMKTTFCNIDWVSGRKEVFFLHAFMLFWIISIRWFLYFIKESTKWIIFLVIVNKGGGVLQGKPT